jgi:hypothetical protein
MKGDFSRMTFDPGKQFMRVLMQQGRVQLDADWNEQVAIFWHYWRTLTQDLIGLHGGPSGAWGFEINTNNGDQDFTIGRGRYYVGGLLCENWPDGDGDVSYYNQVYYPLNKQKNKLPSFPFLVYLDVWERHVTYVEAGHIREVALGGPDTATRSQVVWQVKTWELTNDRLGKMPEWPGEGELAEDQLCEVVNEHWETAVDEWWPPSLGRLRAQTEKQNKATDPCITAPESRYRGAENQLYRVEIHKGGTANEAIYKWSRDNGSIIFPIHMANGNNILLTSLGRDNGRTLNDGDIVEIVDDAYELRHGRAARPLFKVAHVDRVDMRVTLTSLKGKDKLPDLPTYSKNDGRNPLLRRWDGYGRVKEDDEAWLTLENGIQIQFAPSRGGEAAPSYKRGDYWLIPARVATGDIEWPRETNSSPIWQPPLGIVHYYAPLAIIKSDGNGSTLSHDCRHKFDPLTKLLPGNQTL